MILLSLFSIFCLLIFYNFRAAMKKSIFNIFAIKYHLPITNYQLPITNHLPFTLYPLPFTTYPLPFTIYHLPFTLYHSPFTIYHSPFTTYTLPFIHHLPFTIHHSHIFALAVFRLVVIIPYNSLISVIKSSYCSFVISSEP